MDRQKMRFTREQQMAIVHAYETSSVTCAELAAKYGCKSLSLISTWRKRLENPPTNLQKSKKNCTFVS